MSVEELNLLGGDDGVWYEDPDKEIPAEIEKVKEKVRTIILHEQGELRRVPPVIAECANLEELYLSGTGIREIPEFVLRLPKLRFLSYAGCYSLEKHPDNFADAGNLEALCFSIYKGKSPPEGVTKLPALKTLAVCDDCEQKWPPDDLGALPNLEALSLLPNGNLRALPASLEGHPKFRSFKAMTAYHPHNLYRFDLASTAKILASCPAFEELELSYFNAGDGYKDLALLSALKRLELRNIAFSGNPFEAIKELRNLERLEMDGAELNVTELPDIFDGLTELQSFVLYDNFVRRLPPSFYRLPKLKYFRIEHCGIAELSEEAARLTNVESFVLHHNMLTSLPESLAALPRLTRIHIEKNNFSQKSIKEIKKKLGKGVRVEARLQGEGWNTKVLRALDTSGMPKDVYAAYCRKAVQEDPLALQYVDPDTLDGEGAEGNYAQTCEEVVAKSPWALEYVQAEKMSRRRYFQVCMKAAQNGAMPPHGPPAVAIEYVKDELLTTAEYIQVCLETVLHTQYVPILKIIKHERLSREDYLKICWVSVLHNPRTIQDMREPTPELCLMAARAGALYYVPKAINTPEFRAEVGVSEKLEPLGEDNGVWSGYFPLG